MKVSKRMTNVASTEPKTIYLIAEGTGETISMITRAALGQFSREKVRVKSFFQVTSKEQIHEIVKEAANDNAMIAFSVIETSLGYFLESETSQRGIKAIDVIGDFIMQLSVFLGERPKEIPGGQYILDEEYYRRIEAVNFAVKHDDGRLPQGLRNADLVLVGLSRTGKTPLSVYLGHHGWKVANVPLHPDMDPPEELFHIDQKKVFGLVISVENLVKVREARLQQLGLVATAKYADPLKIADEIEWCAEYYKKYPRWSIVDISDKAIEEAATSILNAFQGKRKK